MNLAEFSTEELKELGRLAIVNLNAIKPELRDELSTIFSEIVAEISRREKQDKNAERI